MPAKGTATLLVATALGVSCWVLSAGSSPPTAGPDGGSTSAMDAGIDAGPTEGTDPATADGEKPRGELTREEIAKVVSAHLVKDIQFCCETTIIKDQLPKFTLKWTIGPDGKVGRVEILPETLAHHRCASCMAGKVKGWLFPKPRGGGSVEVTYPMIIHWVGF